METKAGTQSTGQDPWDAALFGGAGASMYKSTPAISKNQTPPVPVSPDPALPAISGEVTSLFKQSAGIPRDIAPQGPVPQLVPKPVEPPTPAPSAEISIPIKTKPPVIPQLKVEDELIISPLSPLGMLLEVPRAPTKATPLKLRPAEPQKALPPAYPVASFVSHLLIVLLGIPLFAAGFYIADYTKDRFDVKNSATVQTALATATSTSPR